MKPNEIEAVKKKKKQLWAHKSAGLDSYTGKFYQTFREELTHTLINLFKKNSRWNTPKLIL